MTQTITVNGVDRSGVIRRKTATWSESAYLGEVGTGSFVIDDDAGNISAVGWKTISVAQSATSPTRLFTGFVGTKGIKRNDSDEIGTGATARHITVQTKDLNDLLTRIVIWDTDGKRPSETVTTRVTWLLASAYLSGLVMDHGAVAASSLVMDSNDYRGSTPFEVLSACARRAGFNFYVRWNAGAAEPELVFRDDNTSTDDTSTISISNTLSEINSTTVFAPSQESELMIDPEHVYSDVYGGYAKGVRTAHSATTESTYVERWGTNDDAGIKTAATADAANTRFLHESKSEENLYTTTLRMRAAYVNLILPGQRVAVKLSHHAQEGYSTSTYFRVLRRKVTQPLNTDNDYDVELDLSPQEAADVPGDCVDIWPGTASGTFYPLGDGGDGGFHANPGGPTVYYLRPGLYYPVVPQTSVESYWHFNQYGAGGAGTIDYAGDCVSNILRLITVGNGTWTIQTEIYGGSTRPMAYRLKKPDETIVQGPVEFTSGDEVTITIDDTSDGDCIRMFDIGDGSGSPCGGKWGWSVATWVAA